MPEPVEPNDVAVPDVASSLATRSRARPVALAVMATTAVFVLGLDVATKQLALTNLADGRSVKLLGGLLYLTLTYNSGAAFSIGGNYTVIFPIVTVVVVGGIVWLSRQLRSLPWALSLGLILGGAFGNLMDRVFREPGPLRGHVVDFLSFLNDSGQGFAIFNLADSALVCGVVLAVLLELTGRRRDGTRMRHSDRDAD